MKPLLTFIALTFLFTSPAMAASTCSEQVSVKVDGMVCDFCARALEKVFGKREEVADIDVDLDSSEVRIGLQPGQSIDDTTLTKLITDSGYNVRAIEKGC